MTCCDGNLLGRDAVLIETFRTGIPVGIGAKSAFFTHEHFARFFVFLEEVSQPVNRHIGKLTAPRVKNGRSVIRFVASASVAGKGESGRLGSGGRTPELNTPIVAAAASVEKAPEIVTADHSQSDKSVDKAPESTHSKILGQITLKRNETLSRIIKGVYGGLNSKYFKSFIVANPDIEDPDRVDVGQIVSLPAIPFSVTPRNTPVWWVRIDDRDSLEAAFNILRSQPDNSPGVRLIPYWNPSAGTRFAVVLDKLFKDEPTARHHMELLPMELAANSTIMSRWDENTVYFANPYF